MAEASKIEWTDATWNIVTGCSVVSPGCTNCYAMRLAGTRLRAHPSRAGLTVPSKAGPVWNGQVRFNEHWLGQPLRWKRARKIFVCAHGDLFHENVPDEWIDRVFAVMALCPQHTFQVLTKRPARMRAYLSDPARRWAMSKVGTFPLPNVWLGVSVEDQRRADERVPELLATPAAVRFVSAEPLLGPVDLTRIAHENGNAAHYYHALDRYVIDGDMVEVDGLDWVIVGSESGPGARPCDVAWVSSLRDQCAAAGVPFFWKQHVVGGKKISTPELDGRQWLEFPRA